MAADTRENATSKPSEPSKSTKSSSRETAPEPYAVSVAPPDANALPAGAGLNTAGGRPKQASYFDALRSIQLSDFQEVHNKPCVRDALLTGIGGGFGISGVRAILGASVWKTCNSAVLTFVFGSFMMYEYCQRSRQLEMQGMKRAVEVIDRKRAEKRKKAEKVGAARRKAKEES
ncbi:MAG: hypothetical protein Q9175_001638 [Cornicularia normoerica]